MSDIENIVLDMLVPIFPNLTHDVLKTSVQHPTNHGVPLTVDTLLQRCIDDLLELRTFTDKTASYRQPPTTIYSDDSDDGDQNTSDDIGVSVKNKQSRNTSDLTITGHTPSKNDIKQSLDDVQITGHTPSKDCMIVPDKSTKKQAIKIRLSKPDENISFKVKETARAENSEKIAEREKMALDDIYREIEFSSDSNSSADLPKIIESSDEDDLPTLHTPTKCSPLKQSKLSGRLQKVSSTPDFSNWRGSSQKSQPGTSVVSTDKSIINGRNDLLVKSSTVPNILTTESSSLTATKGNVQLSSNTGPEQNRGLTATFNVNNSTDNMNVNITVNVSGTLSENKVGQNELPLQHTNNILSHSPSSSGRNVGEQKQSFVDHRPSLIVSRPQGLQSSPMPTVTALNLTMPKFPSIQSTNVRNKNPVPASAIHRPFLHNAQQIRNPANVLPTNRPNMQDLLNYRMRTAVTNTVSQPPVLLMRPQAPPVTSTITRPQNPHILQGVNHQIQNMVPHASQAINHNVMRMLAGLDHPRGPRPMVVPTAVNIIPRPSLPFTIPTRTVIHNIQHPVQTTVNKPHISQTNDNHTKTGMILKEEDELIIPIANEVVVTTQDPFIQINDDKKQGRSDTSQIPDTTVIIPEEEETPEMKINKKKKNLRTEMVGMFPDVDPNYIDELYDRFYQFSNWEMLTMNVCNTILENPQYPRRKTAVFEEKKVIPKIDYYKEYSSSVTITYRNQCEMLLQSEFKWISLKDIRAIMKCYNNHYAPSHKAMTAIMKKRTEEYAKIKENNPFIHPYSQAKVETTVDGIYGERSISITFLKCGRPHRSVSPVSPELVIEKEFIKIKAEEEVKEMDHMLAVNMNEHEYEESGQLIECGCCYGEVAFENMIQCYEGHLFCQECLQRYAQESVFGHGKADLLCMTDGCDANYPISQLQKALPSNILSKYEDRVQEESINLADLTDLVRCPGCDFAALLDEGDKVFKCHNTSCLKETCRYCKEDWKEHFGKRCEEIEKKDEVKIRLQFEEKMTEAKIRTCHKCKAKFTKSDGCNKMTCRCGAKMCYICKKPNIDYDHFCRHFLDPSKGKTCTECTACSLWTNPEQDDERAVSEIKKVAEETRKAMGFDDDKLIGAPDEPPSKRPRLEHPGHPHVHIQIR